MVYSVTFAKGEQLSGGPISLVFVPEASMRAMKTTARQMRLLCCWQHACRGDHTLAENVLVALVVPHRGTPSLRDSSHEGIYHGDIYSLRNPPRKGSPHGCIVMGAPCLKSSTVLMTNQKSTGKYFLKPCNCENALCMLCIILWEIACMYSSSYSWTFHS